MGLLVVVTQRDEERGSEGGKERGIRKEGRMEEKRGERRERGKEEQVEKKGLLSGCTVHMNKCAHGISGWLLQKWVHADTSNGCLI